MMTQGKIRILTEVKKIQMTCGLEMLWPFFRPVVEDKK